MKKVILVGLIVINVLSANSFEKRENIVYDLKIELSWIVNPITKKMKWKEAQEYCKSHELRLPNLYELKSLVDYKKHNPAIRTNLIEISIYDWYWTSSGDSSATWMVNFWNGLDHLGKKLNAHYVLCVRGE